MRESQVGSKKGKKGKESKKGFLPFLPFLLPTSPTFFRLVFRYFRPPSILPDVTPTILIE
jgi:hypothetical protein